MRKIVLILTAFLALLCACAKKETSHVYDVERYGRSYIVDEDAQTVAYNGVVYAYAFSPNAGGGYSVTFTAPDGSTGFWDESDTFGSGGWSGGWDTDVWPSDLADAVKHRAGETRERQGNPLLGLLLIAVGAFNALAPGTAWYLSHGWRYKNAEPSEAALALGRFGGAVGILIGIICFFA